MQTIRKEQCYEKNIYGIFAVFIMFYLPKHNRGKCAENANYSADKNNLCKTEGKDEGCASVYGGKGKMENF